MSYNPKEAEGLSRAIVKARAEMSSYLEQHFPTGTRCQVFLMDGQKTPTPATIAGVSPTIYGGEVTVEIDTAKKRSRQRFRSIPARRVIVGLGHEGVAA